MSVRVRAFIYFAILILLCGMLMPSNPSSPIVFADKLKDLWGSTHMPEPPPAHPWSYQTHLATDTWEVFPPNVVLPKFMDSRTRDWLRYILWSGTIETVACVGEISGVDLEISKMQLSRHEVSYDPHTIAHLKTLEPLSADCPDSLSIYSEWAEYMSARGPKWFHRTDTGQYQFACGDRILAILGKNPRLESECSPVWEVFMYWHLKNSASDRAQYIYRPVSSGLDDNAMTRILPGYRGHLSAFCWRKFETRGETLQEGIEAVQALYASASPAVVRK